MQEKYSLSPDYWNGLAQNKTLRLKINAEHERRVRNGTAAQESAAKIFAEAPEVLGNILQDKSASPRHRIEAGVNCEQPQTPVPKAPATPANAT